MGTPAVTPNPIPVAAPAPVAAPTSIAQAATQVATPVAPVESKWHSILDHVKAFFGIAIKDVQKYEPRMVALAETIFPTYATMIATDQAIVVGIATTIKNTVLTIEQKYSDAVKGDTTNAAKLEDALAITAPTVIPTLQTLKVPVPSAVSDVVAKIEAVVAVAKTWTVPVSQPSEIGT